MANIRREHHLAEHLRENNFVLAVEDAIKWTVKNGNDIAVFINHEGFHICREYKYCEPSINIRFVVINKLCIKSVISKRSRTL